MSLSTAVGHMWRSMPPSVRNLYHQMPMPIRRLINRAVFEDQEQVVEVQTGVLQGAKFSIRPRSESGYYLGTYEPDVQESIARLIKPGMTVFDVGANIGFFAIAVAKLVGPAGTVVAFEPGPEAFARLKHNVGLNGLEKLVRTEHIAAGDFDGTANFCFTLNHGQGRFSDMPYVPQDAETTPVPCFTLDSYVASTCLVANVVIMDVEHAEGRVLRGMKTLLERHKPLVLIEMHGREAIQEAFSEIVIANYKLLKLPKLEPVEEANEISLLGHYLAVPAAVDVSLL
jgi:FkbM family methyltransferase